MSLRLILLIVLSCMLLQVSAIGMGAGFEGGCGWGEEREEDVNEDTDGTYEFTRSKLIFMLMDTYVGTDRIFLYRLKMGAGRIDYSHDIEFLGGRTDHCDTFSTDQIYGYSFLRTGTFKVWAGPSMTFESLVSEEKHNRIHFGIGPALGCHLIATPDVAFSAELAYHYEFDDRKTFNSTVYLSIYTILISNETWSENP